LQASCVAATSADPAVNWAAARIRSPSMPRMWSRSPAWRPFPAPAAGAAR